jgi:starvation-inducible DNA-binding protein
MNNKQLIQLFADNFAVYTKAHGYHFNVTGPDFFQYHKLFGEIYDYLYDQHDVLGELIRQLGDKVPTGLDDICALTVMDCKVPVTGASNKMISDLCDDLESLSKATEALCKSCNNAAVETVLGDYVVGINKFCWFLRSSI